MVSFAWDVEHIAPLAVLVLAIISFFLPGVIEDNRRIAAARRSAVDDLTKEVFSWLRVDSKANPLYTALFINDYVKYLRGTFPSEDFRNIDRVWKQEAADEMSKAYVLYEIQQGRAVEEVLTGLNVAPAKFNELVISILRAKLEGEHRRILYNMFKPDDYRILLQREYITDNVEYLLRYGTFKI